eukprot:CAMPEP_0206053260 /NCGR_PEP_ID=MMETSP1466-20131121/35438_1 /ASSEMBLY_ACC=CAM_ASM_001126 /TAXON_ID=44452 /ORGANISM="Pavlova gyrans, Strain CCMP608" /LENGTH=175 /DNA_ID=CAMNT_0053428431 /DNA_START=642 /DNA_END=1167 /DNA_ORIENTATION=+
MPDHCLLQQDFTSSKILNGLQPVRMHLSLEGPGTFKHFESEAIRDSERARSKEAVLMVEQTVVNEARLTNVPNTEAAVCVALHIHRTSAPQVEYVILAEVSAPNEVNQFRKYPLGDASSPPDGGSALKSGTASRCCVDSVYGPSLSAMTVKGARKAWLRLTCIDRKSPAWLNSEA